MFESISIGRAAFVDAGTIGTLAECLLFYGRVHVIVDHVTFTTLARVCGPETLVGLVQDGNLAVTFLENRPAVTSQGIGANERHSFVFFQAKGYDSQNHIPRVFQELLGKSGTGRRLASRLLSKISTKSYTAPELALVVDEISDPLYTDQAVPKLLSAIVPTYASPMRPILRVHRQTDSSFVIETNIDLESANVEYQRMKPSETLSKALLIDYLYEGSAEIAFAATSSSELALAETESIVVEANLSAILERSAHSDNVRSAFQRLVVPGARSVAEAVNDGRRSLEDIRRLLPKAGQFRKWLESQPHDADLIREYVQQTTDLDWISKLPAKSLRFILFNAAQIALGAAIAGPHGALAGLAIGATDTFLLDKVALGWKPHHFIRGPFSKFVGSEE